ncbi:MAG: thermonuclease family protein [Sphingobium sp.]
MLLAACLAGLGYTQIDFRIDAVAVDTAAPPVETAEHAQPDGLAATGAGRAAVRFGLCHSGGGRNCVVDGDTFRVDGAKIRIADIDTPETHPPRCAEEAELGARATRRLQALLNQGPFELEISGRATDRYGRQLRTVVRDGRSIGDLLVAEGLARPYGRGRRSWCD